MANSYGTINDSTLVYDMIDELVLDLKPILNLAYDFGKHDSDEGKIDMARPGDTVLIKDFNMDMDADVYSMTPATGYAVQNDMTVAADVPFVLPSTVTAISQKITSDEYRLLNSGPGNSSQAYTRFKAKMHEKMMYSLKKDILSKFYAVITSANFTDNFVSAVGTFTRSEEIDLETQLFEKNLAVSSEATVICSPALWGEARKDRVVIHSNTGMDPNNPGTRRAGQGWKSDISDMTFYRTNVAMPGDAPRGFAYTWNSVICVARPPHEAAMDSESSTVDRAVFTEPETGMSFLARVWENPANGDLQFDIGIIIKFQALQDEALTRITLV